MGTTDSGITGFFGGLGQHLGQTIRNERAADALAVGDRVRYHGSLERHHGEGVLREVGRVCRVLMDSGREVDCNASSVTKLEGLS